MTVDEAAITTHIGIGESLSERSPESPDCIPAPGYYQIEDTRESECARILFARHTRTFERIVMKILRDYKDTRYSLETVGKRQQCQLEALQRNRVFTPEVYIGLARIDYLDLPQGRFPIDEIIRGGVSHVNLEQGVFLIDEIIENPTQEMLNAGAEYALMMRQLPEERRLDHLLSEECTEPSQSSQQAVQDVAKANPNNIQEVAASQLSIINSYYQSGLQQSQRSFNWSLIWGGIGLVFLIAAVSFLLFRQPTEVAYASGIRGAFWVTDVAWSPDGRRIASGGGWDNTVRVWDAANGDHVYTYQGHSSSVRAVAWSPDGKRIASGSWDKTIQIWQAPPIETKASSPPEKKPISTSPSLGETISTVATVGLITLTVTASIATIVQTLIVVQERWEKTHHRGSPGSSQHFPQPGKTDIYAIRLRMTDGRERTLQKWLDDPDELKHFIDVFNQPDSQTKPTEVVFVLWSRELMVVDVTEGAQGNLQLDEMLKYLKIDPAKK